MADASSKELVDVVYTSWTENIVARTGSVTFAHDRSRYDKPDLIVKDAAIRGNDCFLLTDTGDVLWHSLDEKSEDILISHRYEGAVPLEWEMIQVLPCRSPSLNILTVARNSAHWHTFKISKKILGGVEREETDSLYAVCNDILLKSNRISTWSVSRESYSMCSGHESGHIISYFFGERLFAGSVVVEEDYDFLDEGLNLADESITFEPMVILRYKKHQGPVTALAILLEDKRYLLISAGAIDGLVLVNQIYEKGDEIKVESVARIHIPSSYCPNSISISSSNSSNFDQQCALLVVGMLDGSILSYDMNRGWKLFDTNSDTYSSIMTVRQVKTEKLTRLITGDEEGIVRLYILTDDKWVIIGESTFDSPIIGSCEKDANFLGVVTASGVVKLWNVNDLPAQCVGSPHSKLEGVGTENKSSFEVEDLTLESDSKSLGKPTTQTYANDEEDILEPRDFPPSPVGGQESIEELDVKDGTTPDQDIKDPLPRPVERIPTPFKPIETEGIEPRGAPVAPSSRLFHPSLNSLKKLETLIQEKQKDLDEESRVTTEIGGELEESSKDPTNIDPVARQYHGLVSLTDQVVSKPKKIIRTVDKSWEERMNLIPPSDFDYSYREDIESKMAKDDLQDTLYLISELERKFLSMEDDDIDSSLSS